MKKTVMIFALAMFSASLFAGTNFRLDKQAVNAAFNTAVEQSILLDNTSPLNPNDIVKSADVSAGGAFIRCWILGSLGWHRAYCNGGGLIFGKYCFTCGGLGILTAIDWWVLLFKLIGDGDISSYENNDGWIGF